MRQRAISLDGNLMPPDLVGVMVLLDRSGSMSSIASAMEDAWQKFLADQRAVDVDGMWVTLHQFDGDGYDVTYDRTPLGSVGRLGLAPRGSTPLRTSMARFLKDARAIVDDPNDPTERLLVVVITDGGETEHPAHPTWAEIREQIQGIESENCELVWLGTSAAILEAEDQVPSLAAAGGTYTFAQNAVGAQAMGQSLSYTAGSYRIGASAKSMLRQSSEGTDDKDWLPKAQNARAAAKEAPKKPPKT